MNKILSGIFTLFVIATVGETHAQTFRTFQTTTQEITYTNRTLADGSVVVETVVETVAQRLAVELHTFAACNGNNYNTLPGVLVE